MNQPAQRRALHVGTIPGRLVPLGGEPGPQKGSTRRARQQAADLVGSDVQPSVSVTARTDAERFFRHRHGVRQQFVKAGKGWEEPGGDRLRHSSQSPGRPPRWVAITQGARAVVTRPSKRRHPPTPGYRTESPGDASVTRR